MHTKLLFNNVYGYKKGIHNLWCEDNPHKKSISLSRYLYNYLAKSKKYNRNHDIEDSDIAYD